MGKLGALKSCPSAVLREAAKAPAHTGVGYRKAAPAFNQSLPLHLLSGCMHPPFLLEQKGYRFHLCRALEVFFLLTLLVPTLPVCHLLHF